MNGNVFMISDASYCSLTKIASLSVFCSHTGKTYNKILKNIQDSSFAETAALLFSIKMAIKLNYWVQTYKWVFFPMRFKNSLN